MVALPPFNGFASEWLTLQSLIAGFSLDDPLSRVAMLGAIAGLALAGGLAAATFVKLFGIAFLGRSRAPESAAGMEAKREAFDSGTLAQALLAGACVVFGTVPAIVVAPLARVASAVLGGAPGAPALAPLASLQTLPLALAALPIVGFLASLLLARRSVRRVPTWTCGSPVTGAAQYTATAFSKPLRIIFGFILQPEHRRIAESGPSKWFPARIVYRLETRDLIDESARWFGALTLAAARRSRALQSGSLRLYLAYAVAAMVFVVALARR